ncbi:MAG TPA: iron-sulfur cluster assembly scaffold protein [Candidatus Dormibacteraeota bacterium]|nr:iron-sulfur cluster assembly scaffold protein [Candidatus Dormibacteraeota bacterium]
MLTRNEVGKYSEALLDHFQNPRNAGELHDANAIVEVTNPVCGDVLKLSARIENARIMEIRFLCRGCTAAIACASLLTELIADKSRAETAGITAERLSQNLGGLPAASFHAADLAIEALSQLFQQVHAR